MILNFKSFFFAIFIPKNNLIFEFGETILISLFQHRSTPCEFEGLLVKPLKLASFENV